jgi:hypothetical protein
MRLLLIIATLLPAVPALAEASAPPTHQSGYEDLSDFGGPEAVGNQIRDADAIRLSHFQLEDVIAGYFD